MLFDHFAEPLFHRFSEPALIVLYTDPVCHAKSQEHALFHPLFRAQQFFLLLKARDISTQDRFPVLVHRIRILEPLAIQKRRRAEPESQIVVSGPISAVVPARVPFLGIVGDLVAAIPVLSQKLPGKVIHLPVLLLGGQSGQLHAGKRRSLFDDQAVSGQVLGTQTDSLAERVLPGLHLLSRQRRHQVQIDIGKSGCPCSTKDLPGFAGRVDPPQKPQFFVVKRLHADRDPVDSALPEGPELFAVRRARIDFHTDLRAGKDRKCIRQTLHQSAHLRSRHQRRRPPAQKDGVHLPGHFAGPQTDLPAQEFYVIISFFFRSRSRQKITIPAFSDTKRKMQV